MDSVFRRRAVALVAAYTVALQALFSAMVQVPSGTSAGPFAILCSHDAPDRSSGVPVQHDLPCAAVCAALGHGIAAPVPPTVVVAVAALDTLAALDPVGDWVPPLIAARSPQVARGPPLV